jgi:hypothetical protein
VAILITGAIGKWRKGRLWTPDSNWGFGNPVPAETYPDPEGSAALLSFEETHTLLHEVLSGTEPDPLGHVAQLIPQMVARNFWNW